MVKLIKEPSGQEVLELLTKLRDGVVRSCSGALHVDDDGRLRAAYFFDHCACARYWAFGTPSLSVERSQSTAVNPAAAWKLQMFDDGVVQFTRPKGASYFDLFKEANANCEEHREQPAVDDVGLGWFWNHRRKEATTAATADETLAIRIVVPDSTTKQRTGQGELIKDACPSLEALAVATVLYYCQTGKDLLQGHRLADLPTTLFASYPITLSPLTVSNANFSFSWSAISGRTYRVQSKQRTDASWNDLTNITASGKSASFSDLVAPTQRFYRVVQ